MTAARDPFPPDVPTSMDFREREVARKWEADANVVRPWRTQFFAAMIAELRALGSAPLSVLDLGSGPGFLAQAITDALPSTRYTLLDFSPAMQELASARLGEQRDVVHVTADMRERDWWRGLPPVDAVVTMQAVHELRHKARAIGLHRGVHEVLRPGGLYLVCDHFLGPGGMSNSDLYMTVDEQRITLVAAGFADVTAVLQQESLVLHRAWKRERAAER